MCSWQFQERSPKEKSPTAKSHTKSPHRKIFTDMCAYTHYLYTEHYPHWKFPHGNTPTCKIYTL